LACLGGLLVLVRRIRFQRGETVEVAVQTTDIDLAARGVGNIELGVEAAMAPVVLV
jgi:hypothetical protein